jgi:hypothetical protein
MQAVYIILKLLLLRLLEIIERLFIFRVGINGICVVPLH